jgi:2-hydroxy-6-oxonona-2,4-dienedioate hydrolase
MSMTELTHDSTSRTVETPKGTLHYHEAGDGPPLLLLHGSGPGVSAWANFRGNIGVFAKHFRTIMMDFPGFGKSYSLDGNPLLAGLPAVLDFIEALKLPPLPVVGNSMGGAIAARLAADHPDKVSRLVTIGGIGLGLFSPAPPEGIKLLVEFVEDPTRERMMAWMESMVYSTDILTDEFVEMRWQAAQDPKAMADVKKLYNFESLKAMGNRSANAAATVDMMTRIKAPTLLTIGRDDRVTPMDGALVAMRYVKTCELHVFYDCGHWAMIERKDEFESTVLSFLLRDLKQA